MKRFLIISLMIVLVGALIFGGCAKPAPEEKTLKIGGIFYLGWPVGLDTLRGIELMVDEDNAKGGLEIGGERHKIEFITYDTNNNQATEVAVVNRLIFEDKVKYILSSEGAFTGAWISTTEENKVLSLAWPPDVRVNQTPDIHYSCNPSTRDATIRIIIGWFCENYPDAVKSPLYARPDNQGGHMVTELTGQVWEAFGATPQAIFYPPDATDLSALGTKVKVQNPSCYGAEAGGGLQDALALKAVYQAGYKGQLFNVVGGLTSTLVGTAGAEAVEGLISPTTPLEFDPPLTQEAQEYKDLWIAKHGTWEGGDSSDPSLYLCLRSALQQAGSLDVDKVAAVIFNGMKFENPSGVIQMISRPDLGNERTVSAMSTVYIKQIKGGKSTLLATIDVDEGIKYVRKAYEYAAQQPPSPPPK